MLTTRSKQYANRAAITAPTIDASLGVGMVGGVKALYAVLLALVLGVGCGESKEEKAAKAKAAAEAEKSAKVIEKTLQ